MGEGVAFTLSSPTPSVPRVQAWSGRLLGSSARGLHCAVC